MESKSEVPEPEDFITTLLKQSSAVSHDNKAYTSTPTSGPPDLVRTCQPLARHNGHHHGGKHLTPLTPKDNASPHASHLSLTVSTSQFSEVRCTTCI